MLIISNWFFLILNCILHIQIFPFLAFSIYLRLFFFALLCCSIRLSRDMSFIICSNNQIYFVSFVHIIIVAALDLFCVLSSVLYQIFAFYPCFHSPKTLSVSLSCQLCLTWVVSNNSLCANLHRVYDVPPFFPAFGHVWLFLSFSLTVISQSIFA